MTILNIWCMLGMLGIMEYIPVKSKSKSGRAAYTDIEPYLELAEIREGITFTCSEERIAINTLQRLNKLRMIYREAGDTRFDRFIFRRIDNVISIQPRTVPFISGIDNHGNLINIDELKPRPFDIDPEFKAGKAFANSKYGQELEERLRQLREAERLKGFAGYSSKEETHEFDPAKPLIDDE